MTCPVTERLGVYALGAADAAERLLIESHLPACRWCREELDRLAPLPGLLASVPAELLRTVPVPSGSLPVGRAPAGRVPADRPRHARVAAAPRAGTRSARPARGLTGRWRSVAGVATAAVLGVGGGFWLAQTWVSQPGASQAAKGSPPGAITLSGANPVTHVRVRVTLTRTSWGTSIRLSAQGLPLNQSCRLIVRSRGGGTEVAGTWDAWRPGPVSIPASAGWLPSEISALRIATTTRNLVTVTTATTAG
jgi:hypothetical protein